MLFFCASFEFAKRKEKTNKINTKKSRGKLRKYQQQQNRMQNIFYFDISLPVNATLSFYTLACFSHSFYQSRKLNK